MEDGSHRWQRRDRSGRAARDGEVSSVPTSKPPAPIILGLARPTVSQAPDLDSSASQLHSGAAGDSSSGDGQRGGDGKPIVVLKSRDDNRSTSVSPGPVQGMAQGESGTPHSVQHPTYPPQRHGSTSQQTYEGSKAGGRLAPPPEMKHGVKVIDEALRWLETGMEDLVDQSDFLVVGALGLQGAGKSTLLSLLGGNSPHDAYRNYIFQPQTKETREDAAHQTVGVDMFVTPERMVLLDTQPVLSTSVLDWVLRSDKKFSPEYTSTENCIEMQSLQVVAFLMTVCHVILVAQDWFADLNLLQCLLTAEMLKPHTPPVHDASGSHQEEAADFYPTVVFVVNKAGQDDFTPETYTDMQVTLDRIFQASKLRYRGGVTMHRDNIISSVKGGSGGVSGDVNLFLLPVMEYYKTEPESILSALPDYRGFPSFSCLLRSFRNQIYSIPRTPLTPTPLSERNWFHFAARMWEAVKKSQLLAEYNRLLP